MAGPTANVILLIVGSIAAVIIVGIALVGFVYLVNFKRALSTNFPWCYSDWKCNAPVAGTSLNTFNAIHTEACGTSGSCVASEPYNVVDLNDKSQKVNEKPKCTITDDTPEAEVVIIDKKTGILCKNTGTGNLCTFANTNSAVAGCEIETCGKFALECGKYKIVVPTAASSGPDGYAGYYGYGGTDNAVIMDPTQWKCDDSSTGTPIVGVGTLYELCSYGNAVSTPSDVTANDFFNAFVYRYNKQPTA